jgi:hypothetical protein
VTRRGQPLITDDHGDDLRKTRSHLANPDIPPPHVVPQPAKTFSQPIVLANQDAAAVILTTYILTVDAG